MPGLPALYTGDAVYGSDRRLRMWLEQKGMSHVLAIKSNEKLWVWPGKGPRQVRADRLAALVDASHWQRRSAGDGAKGPQGLRLGQGGNTAPEGTGQGLLAAGPGSVTKPGELAYYVCFGLAGTTLEELVRIAGARWAIEECFEEAKGQVGAGPV